MKNTKFTIESVSKISTQILTRFLLNETTKEQMNDEHDALQQLIKEETRAYHDKKRKEKNGN